MNVTVQFMHKVGEGMRTSNEFKCDSPKDADEQAITMTRDRSVVAVVRMDGVVTARYFIGVKLP
jgi:hypothetical protein